MGSLVKSDGCGFDSPIRVGWFSGGIRGELD